MSSMQKSLLRVEDWAPKIQYHRNPHWNEILRILNEFEQLVETQKKQILECIRQLSIKRIELIKSFYHHKTSLLFHNELKKQNIVIYDYEVAKQFFHGYFSTINEIVRKVASNPNHFAQIISTSSLKKLESLDFAQNILYNLYPSYLPPEIQCGRSNKFLQFIEYLIHNWDYDVKYGRPKSYSLVDQVINGVNKSPEIVCYVENISMQFMKELNKCKMDIFAFDEDALKHEMEAKRAATMSSVEAPKKHGWNKFKSWFGSSNEKDVGYFSQTSEKMDPEQIDIDLSQIMKARQQNFFNVVKKTIEAILNEPTPFLLNQMMRFFHEKLERRYLNKHEDSDSINTSKHEDSFLSQNQHSFHSQKTELSFLKKSKSCGKEIGYERHYCYFLFTNLIFEELHNKFTISHEDTGMSPADLQNITEIIRIMSNIFQGNMPEGDKYKNEKIMGELSKYLKEIPAFYKHIIERAYRQTSVKMIPNLQSQQQQQFSQEIRKAILKIHENTLVLSFNDIRSIIEILRTSPFTKELGLSQKSGSFSFLISDKYKGLYTPTTHRIDFDEKKHEIEKILFVFNSSEPAINDIVDIYIGKQSPLKNLPILTKALMYNSNLQVTESLEINKSLSLIQNLPLKELKYYLKKISIKYSNLYLKDSKVITDKFRQTILSYLKNNLKRKSLLLLHRDTLINRISANQKLISFYCDELQSSQLYDRISQAFIKNMKIKMYMRIQNDELRVYSSVNNMEGVNIKSILLTDSETKSKTFSEDYILRNSFKNYTKIQDLIQSIVKNNITRSAVIKGRRVDEFNKTFHDLCEIVLSYVEDFMKKREIFQNLNKQKLSKLIVKKIQDFIFIKCKSDNILSEDLSLKLNKNKINAEAYFEKDLKEIEVDWDFLVDEGRKKFKMMSQVTSIADKTYHFEELIRISLTIIGFTIPNHKISAEILTPILQYIVLKSNTNNHYECLYALQSLKHAVNPETIYYLIAYKASLTYVNEMMPTDFPLS